MFSRTVKSKFEIAVVLVFFVLAIMKVSPALLILAAIPFGWCYVWWRMRSMAQTEQAQASSSPADHAEPARNEERNVK